MQILAIVIIKLDIDCPVEISGLQVDRGAWNWKKKLSHLQVRGIYSCGPDEMGEGGGRIQAQGN